MKLFKNGKIVVKDGFVQHLVSDEERIIWLGDDLPPAYAAIDDVVELAGKTVLPSFWDIHTHPLWVAETLNGVACTPPNVNSITEMIAALKVAADQSGPAGGWVEGWGYDESKLAEGRTPTIHDLDQVSTTRPVYVGRSDCHSCAVNSVALKMAGITKDTPDPAGGFIGHFDDGQPNGVFIENGASQLIKQVRSEENFETVVKRALQLGAHYRKRGIGVISDMISLTQPYDYAEIYSEACRRGLPQKVYLYYSIDAVKGQHLTELPQPSHENVMVAGVKLFMDGTISNQTAHMKQPFKDSDSTGFTINTKEDLLFAYEFAKRNRCQIAIHAMGDASIQLILDTYKDLTPWLTEVPSVRIEHVTLLSDAMLAEFAQAKMNFAFVTQIIFLYAEYASYSQNLEAQRLKMTYRLKSMLDSGVATALSSDAPATAWFAPDDVFTSLTAAVTRKGANGEDLNAAEALDLATALSLYTDQAAAIVPDGAKGLLAVGERADLIVLSEDLFATKPEDWPRTRVVQMYLQGREIKEG